jgi:hypothetical protein
LEGAETNGLSYAAMMEAIPQVFSWITWREVRRVFTGQGASFQSGEPSVSRTVSRPVASVTQAIDRHT